MNDVKKTWCGPVYTLDPEKMERQFNRLSAEGWQLEGTGWFSLRYRRGKPRVPLPCAIPLRVPRRSEGRLCAWLPRAAFLYAIFTG